MIRTWQSLTITSSEETLPDGETTLRRFSISRNRYKGGSGATPSSQLSTKEYLQRLRELAEGKPELEAGLRQVEGLIVKDRGSGFRGKRGSLIYQSNDGD